MTEIIDCSTQECVDHLERVRKIDPKTPIYLIGAIATVIILTLITDFYLC